jgi:hypothetical protein
VDDKERKRIRGNNVFIIAVLVIIVAAWIAANGMPPGTVEEATRWFWGK